MCNFAVADLEAERARLAAAPDVDPSVPRARNVLAGIAPVMEEVSGAATQGEPPPFPDPSLLEDV